MLAHGHLVGLEYDLAGHLLWARLTQIPGHAQIVDRKWRFRWLILAPQFADLEAGFTEHQIEGSLALVHSHGEIAQAKLANPDRLISAGFHRFADDFQAVGAHAALDRGVMRGNLKLALQPGKLQALQIVAHLFEIQRRYGDGGIAGAVETDS